MNSKPINLKFILSIISGFLLILTVSCEKNTEDDMGMGMEPGKEVCDPDISFLMNIQPIINAKCIMCHNGTVQTPDFRSYAAIKANAARVKELTAARIMPKEGSLTNEQIKLIGCWVDNGAPDN